MSAVLHHPPPPCNAALYFRLPQKQEAFRVINGAKSVKERKGPAMRHRAVPGSFYFDAILSRNKLVKNFVVFFR